MLASVGRQQCIEYSDCLKEDDVVKSGGGSIYALVLSFRWQEDKESMKSMRGVVYNAGGLSDGTVVVKGVENE